MKYVVSKARISKDVAPIINDLIKKNNVLIYYEPFCGGLNMMEKIRCPIRCGNDVHRELIALLKKFQQGYEPPETITEEEYVHVRDNKELYPDYYVGLVGFCAVFGSKYFGGFARGKTDKGEPRDYYKEAIRNIKKQLPYIQDVKLGNHNYLDIDMSNLDGALIYCDPPYRDTTKYNTGSFDYDAYYNWCREVAKTNILIPIILLKSN